MLGNDTRGTFYLLTSIEVTYFASFVIQGLEMIKSNVSKMLVVEEQGLLCWSEVFVGVLQYFHIVGLRCVKLGGFQESLIDL